MPDASHILNAIDAGDPQAASQLLVLVYDELRQLAAAKLAREKPGQTLDATGLVHEAYLRLVPAKPQAAFANRAHFFAAAAEAMRRILVENARRKNRLKRGGGQERVELTNVEAASEMPADELIDLDEALQALAQEAPRKAELVKLRYFTGLSLEESADCLGIARPTAARDWAYARAWLFERLTRGRARNEEF